MRRSRKFFWGWRFQVNFTFRNLFDIACGHSVTPIQTITSYEVMMKPLVDLCRTMKDHRGGWIFLIVLTCLVWTVMVAFNALAGGEGQKLGEI